MTIIPRVRGSLALRCCFAKQPLLLPTWDSECRNSYLIQVFISITSLYPTSTAWVLQVAVVYIASCLFAMVMIWRAETSHPQKEKHILAGGRKRTQCPQKDSHKGLASPVQWSQVWFLAGWKRRVGTVGLCRTWALAASCPHPPTPAAHWAQPLFGHILPPGHRMPLSSCTVVQTWK